jgi:hypothetical protein
MVLMDASKPRVTVVPPAVWGLLFVVCLGVPVCAGAPVSAEERSAAGPASSLDFDIPAQPVDSALEAYTRTTGLQVLYKNTLTASLTSNAVRGRLTPRNALEQLLAGTNLTVRFTADSAFTVVAIPASRAVTTQIPVPGRQVFNYEAFLGDVQESIIASLCRSTVTRPGSYRAALQFSISPSGVLGNASLLGSTGDAARDRVIAEVLQGVTVGKMPLASMPQPVTMLITPRRPNLPDECQRFSQPSSFANGRY